MKASRVRLRCTRFVPGEPGVLGDLGVVLAMTAFLADQLRDDLVQGGAPNVHGVDLIRIFFESVWDLQFVQAGDEHPGAGTGYWVVAAGGGIEIGDVRANFLGRLESLGQRLRFAEKTGAKNAQR